MNETLTVFMISEIERLREEGREPARRIYHNMLRTLRESAGKEEIGFEEVTPVFLGKYEHWLLGKRLSWNTVSTYMRALRAGYNRGMKGRPGYVTGLFDKVYTGTRSDVKRAVDARTVGRMIRMSGCPDESASAKAVDWFVLMFMLRGIPGRRSALACPVRRWKLSIGGWLRTAIRVICCLFWGSPAPESGIQRRH